ncbi:MAG: AAA family ATPase [Lachnospiraceae bacterium]|nr:AAA family ATPase [Lachnospiraceae bacterium]MDY5742054.1 AAA family ATPase [Lachnospiraceae bacterium]
MWISELEIYGFGVMQNRRFRFGEGLTLICGGNESGKTTLFYCLLALLYGMKKPRGRSSLQQAYLRYDPGEGRPYAAAATIHLPVGEVRLYRDFRNPSSDCLLLNDREQSVRLLEQWLPIGERWLYLQTFALSGLAGVSKEDLSSLLQAYIRAAEGGSAGFLGERSLELLRGRQREISRQITILEQECREAAAAQSAKLRLLEEQKLRVEEQLQACTVVKSLPKSGNTDEFEPAPRLQSAGVRGFLRFLEWLCLLGGGALLVFGLMRDMMPAVTGGAVILALSVILFLHRIIQHDVMQDEDMRLYRRQVLEPHRLEAEKRRSYQKALEREWKQLDEQQRELQQDKAAEHTGQLGSLKGQAEEIRDAQRLLQTAVQGQNSEGAKGLEQRVNALYHRIEEQSGRSIGFTGERLLVRQKGGSLQGLGTVPGRETQLESLQLSTGTLQLLYLLLRLTVTEYWPGDLPYLWDDALLTLDDKRAAAILRELADRAKQHQVWILTCQKREQGLLSQAGIPFRVLDLESAEV